MRTLTIVVPVTKMSGRLQNLAQWLPEVKHYDVEVIIIHDIQDLNTSGELRNIIERESNTAISCRETKLGAPGLARNIGLATANSQWIMFVDSDDLLELKEVFNLLATRDHDNQILVGSFAIKNLQNIDAAPLKKLTRNKADLAMNPGLWRLIIPLKIAQQHRFTKFRMGEDQEYILGLEIFVRDLKFSRIAIYTYFKGDSEQLTNSEEAISELGQVIPITILYLQKSEIRSGFYVALILVRQILTEFKHRKDFVSKLQYRRIREVKKLGLIKKLQLIAALILITGKKITNA
jgi:glycosyltransferase involved in cell wall biosynthesis